MPICSPSSAIASLTIFTSTSSTNPTAGFGNPNPGLVVGGTTYLRQTGTAITRGLIQPRTYGVELQYRF